MYLDAMQFEASSVPGNYEQKQEVELGAYIENVTDYAYLPSENVEVKCALYSSGNPGKNLTVKFILEDIFGKKRSEVNVPATLDAEGRASIARDINSGFMGPVRLKIQAFDGDKKLAEYQLCWTVIPELRTGVNPDNSRFGMHILKSAAYVQLSKKIGARWNRLHDMGWQHYIRWDLVEPVSKGNFVFQDDLHNMFVANDIRLTGTLFATPGWAAVSNPVAGVNYQGYVPMNFTDYTDYIQAVMNRYGNYLKHYEIWNEPYYNPHFWNGTPLQYVNLLNAAFLKIKTIDANAKVLGGCININPGNKQWAEAIFSAGALNYMDVLSYHSYYEKEELATSRTRDEVNEIKAMASSHGKPNIPIWNSECGIVCSDFNTQAVDGLEGDNVVMPTSNYLYASAGLVRKLVDTFACGVKKLMFYFSCGRTYYTSYNSFSIRGLHGNLKPTGAAYAYLANQVDGLDFDQCIVIDQVARIYIFKDSSRCVAVVWGDGLKPNENTKNWNVDLTGLSVQQIDLVGNTVNPQNSNLCAIPFYLQIPLAKYQLFVNAVNSSQVQ